jgi:hypothetical protein
MINRLTELGNRLILLQESRQPGRLGVNPNVEHRPPVDTFPRSGSFLIAVEGPAGDTPALLLVDNPKARGVEQVIDRVKKTICSVALWHREPADGDELVNSGGKRIDRDSCANGTFTSADGSQPPRLLTRICKQIRLEESGDDGLEVEPRFLHPGWWVMDVMLSSTPQG